MIPSISRRHPQVSASDNTRADASDTAPQKSNKDTDTHTHTNIQTAITARVCP